MTALVKAPVSIRELVVNVLATAALALVLVVVVVLGGLTGERIASSAPDSRPALGDSNSDQAGVTSQAQGRPSCQGTAGGRSRFVYDLATTRADRVGGSSGSIPDFSATRAAPDMPQGGNGVVLGTVRLTV